MAETIRHVAKRTITVMCSPQYWAHKLKDLKVLVNKHGLPQIFLTLTIVDSTELRWVEYDTMAIEAFVKIFNASFRAGHAPVEADLLFHRKVDDLLQQSITSDNGIFGKAQLLVDRYEVQGRDALHAHLVLWVDKADHERVRGDIVA
jgi:hypothetical protein